VSRRAPAVLALALLGATLSSRNARAADDLEPPAGGDDDGRPRRLAGPFSQRPLTLPIGVLALDASAEVLSYVRMATLGTLTDTGGGLLLGAAAGLTDRLQLSALVTGAPLGAQGAGPAWDAAAEAIYRLGRERVQVGLAARVDVPLDGGRDTALGVSAPVLVRLGSALRLDTGLGATLHLNEAKDVDLLLPLALSLDFGAGFYARLITGLEIPSVDVSKAVLPLRLAAAYTVMGQDGPLADLGPAFELPKLATPGAPSVLDGSVWTLAFMARVFLYL
jgi:hypothetical protein